MVEMKLNRILIVGISGTGKTRLAKQLSIILNLPVIYLDTIFWKENWQEENPKVVEAKIKEVIGRHQWIIEGYVEPLGKLRVERADLVLCLDYPGRVALLGGLQRWLQYRHKARPEMPIGNTESLGFKFLMTLLRRRERPEIEAAILGNEDKVVRLKSRRQTERYLTQLNSKDITVAN